MEGILALLIPIVALSIPIVAIWTRHQQKIAEMQISTTAEHTAEKAAQYASKIQALEDRVRTHPGQWFWIHRRWKGGGAA